MIKRPKIWVVGDVMLDVSVRSEKFRRTPEDVTVPVLPDWLQLSARGTEFHAGGAANVAANLKALGCEVGLFTRFVGDEAGRRLLDTVPGVSVGWPPNDPRGISRTTVKVRYYEGSRMIARYDVDGVPDQGPVRPPENGDDRPDAVIVTDYGKGSVDRASIVAWLRWCRERNIPLFGDPKLGRTNLWSGLKDVVFVANFDEAREFLSECAIPGRTHVEAAIVMCERLASEFSTRVVKCGKYGSVYGEGIMHKPIEPVAPKSIYDVQGAGDTYLAGLVAAKCRGVDYPLACLFASAAAGVAVGVPGTATVPLQQVLEALKPTWQRPANHYQNNLFQALELGKLGYRIGLTNGCFDLAMPHPGHLKVIREAAKMCDFLFVAIDSDARVRELKGEGRPHTPIAERVAAVSELRAVFGAFEFDTSMDKVVRDFRPAVLVKGGDYETKGVPEASHLAEWGGKLTLVPLEETRSTTERLLAAPGQIKEIT